MSASLTTTLLNNPQPAPQLVLWDVSEAHVTLPLHGVWLAVVKTTTTQGQVFAPGANPTTGAPGQVPTTAPTPQQTIDVDPKVPGSYNLSGQLYSPTGQVTIATGEGPSWVYTGLGPYQPVTLTLGGVAFNGTIVRMGIIRGQVSLLIQAGVNQVVGYPGGGQNRVGQPLIQVLQAVAQAANVTLSSLIDPTQGPYAALLNPLTIQPSATFRLADTLDLLVQQLNQAAGPGWATRSSLAWPPAITPVPDLYHWRFLPDGTLWLGLDFYPTESASGTSAENPPVTMMATEQAADQAGIAWLDNRPQQALETFGVVSPVLFPGDTYVSYQTPYALPWPLQATVSQACTVEYQWNGKRLVMSVLSGAGSFPVIGVISPVTGNQGSPGW